MALDLTKPVRTRSGDPVEIIATNGRKPFPLIGYVGNDKRPECWTKGGAVWGNGYLFRCDIINISDAVLADEPTKEGE